MDKLPVNEKKRAILIKDDFEKRTKRGKYYE